MRICQNQRQNREDTPEYLSLKRVKVSEANIRELESETMFIAFRSIVGFLLMCHVKGFASRFEDTCPRHVSRAATRDFRFSNFRFLNFRLIQMFANCLCHNPNYFCFNILFLSLFLACNCQDPFHLLHLQLFLPSMQFHHFSFKTSNLFP